MKQFQTYELELLCVTFCESFIRQLLESHLSFVVNKVPTLHDVPESKAHTHQDVVRFIYPSATELLFSCLVAHKSTKIIKLIEDFELDSVVLSWYYQWWFHQPSYLK